MRPRGITLWELLCTLAVAGILLGVAVPGLERFALDARRTADVNAFVLAVQLARSEAYKRARPVVLCKTADRFGCGGDEIRYDRGWMVFVNDDDLRPPSRSDGEPLLYTHTPAAGAHIASNRKLFEFRPFGRRSTNGTVVFCDRRGEGAARAVILSYTGRPRASSRGPGGQRLVCEP
jgi:type IV fimbrial biogenesis protein FimT